MRGQLTGIARAKAIQIYLIDKKSEFVILDIETGFFELWAGLVFVTTGAQRLYMTGTAESSVGFKRSVISIDDAVTDIDLKVGGLVVQEADSLFLEYLRVDPIAP